MIKVPCLALGMPFSLDILGKPYLSEALCTLISAQQKPGKILVIATVNEAIGVAQSLQSRFPDRTVETEIISLDWYKVVTRRAGIERSVWNDNVGTVVVLDNAYLSFFHIKRANELLSTSPVYINPFFPLPSGRRIKTYSFSLPAFDFQPIVIVSPPFSGTGRFMPVILKLMQYFGVPDGRIVQYYINHRQHKRSPYNKETKTLLQQADASHIFNMNKYYDYIVRCMEYYTHGVIHDFLFPEIARQNPDVQFLYLMRDPRDLFTSLYHGLVFDLNEKLFDSIKLMDKDQAIAWLMREGATITTERKNYASTIPSLEQIASIFVEVSTLPNVHIVRYERLRNDPARVYREVLKFLRLDTISLSISVDTLDGFIEAGTFASQSFGEPAEESNAARSCAGKETFFVRGRQRGVVGGWANHFGPESKALANEMAGTLLDRLGYATTGSE